MFRYLGQHIIMTLEELRANKLRTFLSLLGVSIGVFCIISVLTVFDSLQKNIQSNMQSLGSNVLYIGKFPWIPEDEGEYQWWKYKARPVCNLRELKAIEKEVNSAAFATLCYSDESQNIKFQSQEVKSVSVFAVTHNFNKLQPFDIEEGRYFSTNEMKEGIHQGMVIGHTVAEELFGTNISPVGKYVEAFNRKFQVIGVMKKMGKTMTGFNFDDGVIISYLYLSSFRKIDNQTGSGFTDPMLMVKAHKGVKLIEMKYEIKSVLRALRKLRPNEADNFSFNQLDAIQNSINSIFANFNIFGGLIGLFSLVVGSFGIANIMFVSVKERTRQIGVKKSLGAKSSAILSEFLLESIILCLLGGLIGILFVLLLSRILSGPMGFPISLSGFNFFLGIGISILVGILAGYIPAKRASKLDPVVAIRS
ncbi:MAG: ABC transporter permease [Chitinophagaceae bacterium]|nr:ABC transporter permease [Chitinophagaceae bacterium]